MKKIITALKERVNLIENIMETIPKEQLSDLTMKLNRVDKELRGIILFQMAVNK